MKRLRRALRLYTTTTLSWCASWRLAANEKAGVSFGKHYRLVHRDGFIYIEPTAQR